MLCFHKGTDSTLTKATCTADEEVLCTNFCNAYTVRYRSATEGLYGIEQTPVTISEHISDSSSDQMTCILQDGVVIGCECGGKSFYVDGVRRYEQISGPGPQDALIWDIRECMLIERKS